MLTGGTDGHLGLGRDPFAEFGFVLIKRGDGGGRRQDLAPQQDLLQVQSGAVSGDHQSEMLGLPLCHVDSGEVNVPVGFHFG